MSGIWHFIIFLILFCINAIGYAEKKSVYLVTENYPPFFHEELPKKGWVFEIVKEAFERSGYAVKIDFFPWQRAVKLTQSGKADGLLGAFWTEERTQWAVYSAPIFPVKTGFFKLKSRNDISFSGRIRSLKGYSIGTGRGYVNEEEFDEATYLNKQTLENSLQGMKMLFAKRLDLVAGNEMVDRYNLRRLENSDPEFKGINASIVFVNPPLKTQHLHIAFSKKKKNHLILVRDFNLGLIDLAIDGSYKKLSKSTDF